MSFVTSQKVLPPSWRPQGLTNSRQKIGDGFEKRLRSTFGFFGLLVPSGRESADVLPDFLGFVSILCEPRIGTLDLVEFVEVKA